MTKDYATRRAGNASRLAELLGCSRAAVSMWMQRLPAERERQLRELRPRWFSDFKRAAARKAKA